MVRTICLVLVAALGSSQAWAAARTITLLSVSGPDGDEVESALERDLGELYEIVPGEVYRSAAQRLDAPGASPEEVSTVARKLRIDAVIGGQVSGSGRGQKLLIAVRDGSDGHVVARGRYDFGGRPFSSVTKRVVGDLVRALDHVRGTGGASRKRVARASSRASDESGALDDPGAFTGGGEGEGEGGGDEGGPRLRRRKKPAERAVPGLQLGVGPSLVSRTQQLTGSGVPSYGGNVSGGLRVEAALFPFALSGSFAREHAVLASFGVAGAYEYVFAGRVPTEAGSSAARASRWEALFLGRIPLGHRAVGGYLQLETGFQQLRWGHDSPDAVGVPDVRYDLVDAGLAWEHTLGANWAQLELRFAYLQPVGAGQLVTPEEYGRASGFGVDASAGLTFRPLRWLWLRLDGRFTDVELSFANTGARYATRSVDRWFGGDLQLGFAL